MSIPDLQSSSHTFGLDMASTSEASAANTGSGVTANDKFFMSSLLNLSQQPTSANNTRSGTNSILICLLSENNIDLTGGQINDPFSGKHYSPPFPTETPSSPSRTLEGRVLSQGNLD